VLEDSHVRLVGSVAAAAAVEGRSILLREAAMDTPTVAWAAHHESEAEECDHHVVEDTDQRQHEVSQPLDERMSS
jgi:hypothetical protein